MTRVEWIEGRARFAALAEDWEQLAEEHPFSDHAWLRAWYEAFGNEPRVAVAWRGTDLVAAFPVVARRGRLVAAANYHSPTFSVPAVDDEAREAVVDAVASSSAGELSVHALATPGATLDALRTAAARHAWVLLEEPAHASPTVDTSGDGDAWLAARGATLRRRRRKLERDCGAQLRLTTDESALDEGFRIEASGWKGRKGSAIVSRPATRAFYGAIARAYAARGEFVQGWLDVDGAPVAWLFALRRHERLFMLKTGYDERARALAPGLVLHLMTAERCFADGLNAYELLGDVERWKLDLSTGVREHRRLWAFRRRPAGLARLVARRWMAPPARALRGRVTSRRSQASTKDSSRA